MTRWLTAALLLAVTAAPALACPWHQSVANDTGATTAAAQPAPDHAAPPAAQSQSHAPS